MSNNIFSFGHTNSGGDTVKCLRGYRDLPPGDLCLVLESHTVVLRAYPWLCNQESLLTGLEGPYGVRGIQPSGLRAIQNAQTVLAISAPFSKGFTK